MNYLPGTKPDSADTPLPERYTFDPAAVRAVDRPLFVNRETLCSVCLTPCDLTTQDIVPYFPVYLSRFDTLRAYDGCYHRACLYKIGDYRRMVEAWHKGIADLLKATGGVLVGEAPIASEGLDPAANRWPRVVVFERDLGAIRWAPGDPLELMQFPRMAAWRFYDFNELDAFGIILERYVASSDRRSAHLSRGALEIRPVANHEVCTLRWAIPLTLTITWPAGTELPSTWQPPPRWRSLFGESATVDLAEAPPGTLLTCEGGHLESELDWNLLRCSGRVTQRTTSTDSVSIRLATQRLRFVPVWDDEAEAIMKFLQQHKSALQKALT